MTVIDDLDHTVFVTDRAAELHYDGGGIRVVGVLNELYDGDPLTAYQLVAEGT